MQHFNQREIGEVAVERGRGPLQGFLDRVDGKFQRHAAACNDTVAHPLDQFQVNAVAGCNVRTRLGNADDRLAALQFTHGETVIQLPLQIERRHVGVIRIVEPVLRTEF